MCGVYCYVCSLFVACVFVLQCVVVVVVFARVLVCQCVIVFCVCGMF